MTADLRTTPTLPAVREKLQSLACWNSLWLVLFFGFISFFFIAAPVTSDDWWFKMQLRPWFEAQGLRDPSDGGNVLKYGIPWDLVWETWKFHFQVDNVRLGNLLVVLLLLLPKWAGSAISSVFFIITVVCSFKMAGVNWKKSGWIPVAILIWTFLFPIQDRFTSLVFQVNYVWGSGITMLLLLQATKGDRGWKYDCISALLGLVAGLWNEGFGVPLLACICALMLTDRRFRTRGDLLAALGLLVGFLILTTAGGKLSSKLTNASSLLSVGFAERWKHLLAFSSYWIILACGALLWTLRRGRQVKTLVRTPLFVLNCTAGLSCTLIMAVSMIQWRVGCCSLIVSNTFLLFLLNKWSQCMSAKRNHWKYWVAAICLGISYLHLACADYVLWDYRKAWQDVLARYTDDPSRQPWARIQSPTRSPWICWVRPDIMFFTHSQMWSTLYYSQCPSEDSAWSKDKPFIVLSSSLRGFTPAKGRRLQGDGGYYEYEGWLVREAGENYPKSMYVDVSVSGGGKTQHKLALMVRFRSDADGKDYCVLLMTLNWFHFRTHPVEAVTKEIYHVWR